MDNETLEVSVKMNGIDELIEKLEKIKKLLNEISQMDIKIEVE